MYGLIADETAIMSGSKNRSAPALPTIVHILFNSRQSFLILATAVCWVGYVHVGGGGGGGRRRRGVFFI